MAAATDNQPEHRDVAARWTPHLASGGWTPVVDFFLDHYRELGVTNLEAIFLVHLIRHKWTAQMPFPGFKRIAKRMGISATAARGHARRLEKKGLLKRVERVGSTNRFDLSGLFQAGPILHQTSEAPGNECGPTILSSTAVQRQTPLVQRMSGFRSSVRSGFRSGLALNPRVERAQPGAQVCDRGGWRRRRSFASMLLATALARLAVLVSWPCWVVMSCDAPFVDTLALAGKSRVGPVD